MNDLPTRDRPSPDRLNRLLADRFHQVVGPLVSPGQPYALLDFPDYCNIGDSAIYAGQMVFFDRHAGRPPDYICTISTYRRDVEDLCPEGTLFLQGGGNFGTVWRRHQRFRHEVLERYRNRRIVQLAQSIHFDPADRQALEASKRAIGNHPDFTLLVRDLPSRDFARAQFDCAVILCPDAAHCLVHLPAAGAPRHEVLALMRDDKEASHQAILDRLRGQGPITDWGRQPLARTPLDRLVDRILAPAFPGSPSLMRRRERRYRRQAAYRLACGVRLLSRGRVIVTDRLHAHLIASLMGRPNLSLDNIYGKISRYLEAWGVDDATLQLSVQAAGVAGFDEALARLRRAASG